jgi:hypothetical protein
MKLVFHEQLAEQPWFCWLLGDLIDEVIFDPDYRIIEGPQIQVISGNHRHIVQRDAFLQQCRAASADLTLLHAGDEWFSGGYAVYRHVDRVIRTHETWLARAPGIFTIPLGYPAGFTAPDVLRPAADRHLLWSFAGQVKASRVAMAHALDRVQPGRLVDTAKEASLSPVAYRSLLSDTLFLPCPMGNVMAETWRLYEALEFGCIPMVEKRWSIDYYDNLLGDAPFLRVSSWREGARTMQALAKDRARLNALQQEVSDWWQARKRAVAKDVRQFMRQGSYQAELARFGTRAHNAHPQVYGALRLVELLRHQSLGSLARRLVRPAGPLQRIRRDLGRRGNG